MGNVVMEDFVFMFYEMDIFIFINEEKLFEVVVFIVFYILRLIESK